MLIQCQACNAKYNLSLDHVPGGKAFVRCKSCGTPIYMNASEEADAEPAPAVIPPEQALAASEAVVGCPSCETRFRVPGSALTRPNIRLKCSRCGHVFAPERRAGSGETPRVLAPPRRPDYYPPPGSYQPMEAGEAADSGPALGSLMAEARGVPEQPPAPAALGEPGELAPEDFRPPLERDDPEAAYLEAVSLGEDLPSAPRRPPRRQVPADQKYRYFLKPGALEPGDEAPPDLPPAPVPEPEAPPVQDAAPPDELPPLPEIPPTAPPVEDELPPLPGDHRPAVDAGELPPLEGDAPEPAAGALMVQEPAGDEDEIPGRERIVGKERSAGKERRLLVALAAAAVLVLVAGAAWGWWLATHPMRESPYLVQRGMPHQISLTQEQSGRYVLNKPSGKRLFVVDGQLENRFTPEEQIRWIRIKGTAFADENRKQPLAEVFSFAGNRLSDEELGSQPLERIRAQLGNADGKADANFSIPAGARLPYQLIFAEPAQPVQQGVAQLFSYQRNGQSVFVDPGQY